eukprot:CAMPEP_0117579350 /NCGR_PEP_ID=MMETSP0784-20121206/64562_1 /TAXON_ID=39447 /ORGANISM="" /LENGTH=225 /DNA_ID=CAMNT_0005379219 /DNA_START=97 /DNA_END=774 /DNA_ORIENTATION=-
MGLVFAGSRYVRQALSQISVAWLAGTCRVDQYAFSAEYIFCPQHTPPAEYCEVHHGMQSCGMECCGFDIAFPLWRVEVLCEGNEKHGKYCFHNRELHNARWCPRLRQASVRAGDCSIAQRCHGHRTPQEALAYAATLPLNSTVPCHFDVGRTEIILGHLDLRYQFDSDMDWGVALIVAPFMLGCGFLTWLLVGELRERFCGGYEELLPGCRTRDEEESDMELYVH